MYAVAFDLVVADTNRYHPKGVPQAYAGAASAFVVSEVGARYSRVSDRAVVGFYSRRQGSPHASIAGSQGA